MPAMAARRFYPSWPNARSRSRPPSIEPDHDRKSVMRYPEDRIKEAILHPDIDIRDRAVLYFAKSFSTDTSIMPLVIKAVETYGRAAWQNCDGRGDGRTE